MAHRKSLTQAQLDVLQWIVDGSPAGVMEDYSHRVSAAALRRRGFVTTRGRGPTWSAKATAEGREYLKRSEEPDAPMPRQANQSVTEKLVGDVIAAGGTLVLPSEQGKGAVDYRMRAAAAERHGKVPKGKRLDVRTDRAGSWVISLVDIYRVPWSEIDEVQVPTRVARYHPVVRSFREDSNRHEISKAQMGRALRTLQALVVAAETKGFTVSTVDDGDGDYGYSRWTGAKDGHIRVTLRGHAEVLRLREVGMPSRIWWERQKESRSRTHYYGKDKEREPMPGYEDGATGMLCLEFVGYSRSQRPSSWADSKKSALEARLAEVLLEVEERAQDAEDRQREADRAALKKREQWERAKAQATTNYIRAFRAKALGDDVASWQRSVQIREFCDAAETKFKDEDQRSDDFDAWMRWARSYADQIDPVRTPPTAPEDPESIADDQLQPFMRGWSAYHPERRGR